MRKIKAFVIGIILIMCFLFGIALLLPSKVTVSKSILINASFLKVENQIRDFNNWKNWYPLFQDKNIITKKLPGQNDSTVDSMEITDDSGRKIIFSLMNSHADTTTVNLITDGKSKINYQFIVEHDGKAQTQIIWNVNTSLGWYPWRKMQGIVMDKLTGPQYTSILQNLKEAVENNVKDSSNK